MSGKFGKYSNAAVLSIVGAAVLAVIGGSAAQDEPKYTIKDSLLAKKPGTGMSASALSPDGRHFAFSYRRDGNYVVVVDGKEIESRLDYVTRLVFDRTGMRLAYDIRKEGRIRAVIVSFQPDGSWRTQDLGAEFDRILDMVFSPDGKRMAVMANRGGRAIIRVDEKESVPFDSTSSPTFSLDGTRLAYVARSGRKERMVIDGRDGPEYDGIMEHDFSADGKHHAFLARRDRKMLVVLGGKEGRDYDTVSRLKISPDGKQAACLASEGAAPFLVIDGEGGREYRDLRPGMFSFGGEAPSRHFAYAAALSGGDAVFIDGQPGGIFRAIDGLLFSPDGRRLAYIGRIPKLKLVLADRQPDGKWIHQESREFEGILDNRLVFSPDGQHVACGFDNPRLLMLDGEPLSELKFDAVFSNPVFDRTDRLNVIVLRGEEFRLIEVLLK